MLALGLVFLGAQVGMRPMAYGRAQAPMLSHRPAVPADASGPNSADVQIVADISPTNLVHAGADERHKVAHLLADDTSAHGLTLLWLLAHDANAEVQATALHATLLRCPKESRTTCAGLLRFFFDDAQADISWEARTALLSDDPEAALQAATKAYKLEVVSLLAGRVGRPQAPDGLWRALRALAQDYEPEVQEAASIVLIDQLR